MLINEIKTERLRIRPFHLEDLPEIHRILDITFGDGMLVNDPAALEERRSWIQWQILSYEWLHKLDQPPYGDRAVILNDGDRLIGSVGLVPSFSAFEQLPVLGGPANDGALWTPEIGLFYVIDPDRQRCGYAAEAARALIDYAFEVLKLKRIIATTEYDNQASIAVMKRLGMEIAENPWGEPAHLQVVGVLQNSS